MLWKKIYDTILLDYKNKNKNMDQQNTPLDILWLFEEEQGQKNQAHIETLEILLPEQEIETPTLEVETDILSLYNFEETQNLLFKENKTSPFKKAFSLLKFLGKYLTTSSLIFIVLLGVMNYSAYIKIAMSYLNPDALEQHQTALLASVQNAKISGTQAITEAPEQQEEKNIIQAEKAEIIKNKTFHSMDKLIQNGANSLDMNIEIAPYENRVIIPKIGKNIPLVEVQNKTVKDVKELENVFMNELINGIVRYPGSARPGEIGNSFIFGHSSNYPWIRSDYNDVFALLDNLSYGDTIIVYYGQKKYTYTVKEKKIIKPGDVSVLKSDTTKSEISLMTCWPVGTTLNRMIVIAELTID